MGIAKGVKLSEIRKDDVERVSYSDQGNLIIRYKGETEWCLVYDNQGNKIPKGKDKYVLEKAAAGNEDILNYLLSEAEEDKDESR